MSFCLQAKTSMKQSNYYRHQSNMKWSIRYPSVSMKTKFGSLSYSLTVLLNFCGNLICIFPSNKQRNRSASVAWNRLDSLNKMNMGSDFGIVKVVCHSLIISRQNTQISFWLAGGRNESCIHRIEFQVLTNDLWYFNWKFDRYFTIWEKNTCTSLLCLPSATNLSYTHDCFRKATKQINGSSRQ